VIVVIMMVIRMLVYHAGTEPGGDDKSKQKELNIFEGIAGLYC
jgi:hypothetical protein